MSYILEALRKSQQQRERGAVPTIASAPHALDVAVPRRGVPAWGLSAVGLAAAALALALALYATFRTPGGDGPAQAVGSAPTGHGGTAAALPATAPAAVAATAPAPPAPAPSRPDPAPAPAEATVSAPRPKPTPATAPSRRAPTAAPATGTPAAAAQPEPSAVTATVYRDLPLLDQLGARERSAVPDYTLNIHVYSDAQPARFVYINGRMYREGERTREGGRVEAITVEGAVLDHQGKRFRLAL